MGDLLARHRETLDGAVSAARERGYWTPYPELPSGKVYGETAKAEGEAWFKGALNSSFELDQPSDGRRVGKERSPYGFDLGITYPAADVDQLVAAAQAAGEAWGRTSPENRVGIALEMLHRINRQSFAMANAVMHTTGQAFMMAFQAGGPHAQDRGLEAVAYAWMEMNEVPRRALWEKPQGKQDPIRLDKEFRIVPRGPALVIGCSTFPTWNGYPGLFASLVTGNPVIVKPHPGAILPFALTVKIGREVLREAGFDPNVLLLAADEADAPLTKSLASNPALRIIDYTGGNAFGRWLRENAAHALVFTEEAGINPVVVHSTDSFKGMCGNLAFSLSLYSGQMCTAPQNIFVPKDGIETEDGRKSFDEVAEGIARAADRLLGDPERAAAVLGAVQSRATMERVQEAAQTGDVVRRSGPVPVEGFDSPRTASPLILKVRADDEAAWKEERFGPISYVIAAEDIDDAISRAAQSVTEKGAVTSAIYSTDPQVLTQAEDAFAGAGVALSENLTGGVFVNQSAAFSDYHVTGANPAGNACLTDSAFVANRFRVVTVRRPRAA